MGASRVGWDGARTPGRRLLRPPPDRPGHMDPGHHRYDRRGPDGGYPLREQVHGGQHPLAAGPQHIAGALSRRSRATPPTSSSRRPRPSRAPADKAAIDKVVASLEPLPYVQGVTSPFSAAGAHQIAQPGHGNIAFAQVQFTTDTADIPVPAIKAVITKAQSRGARRLQGRARRQPHQRRGDGGARAERGHRLTAAVLILLLAFGSVVAMGLPSSPRSPGSASARAARPARQRADGAELLAQIAAMIGIGVGIDYALFIVTRYRQGLHEGCDPERGRRRPHHVGSRGPLRRHHRRDRPDGHVPHGAVVHDRPGDGCLAVVLI